MKQAVPVKSLTFPSIYNWFLFAPLITFFLAIAAKSTGASVYLLSLNSVGFAALLFLYVIQIRFLKQAYPKKKLMPQIFLPVFAFIAPIVAVFMGDFMGQLRYNTASNGFMANIGVGAVIGVILVFIVIYSFAIGNMLYILSKGTNTALTKFGKFMYGVGILFVMVISFFVYSFIYSLHDPSTE